MARMSCWNSTDPGQSRNVMVSPRKVTVATFGSTLMAWARASALASPTVLPVDSPAGALDGAGASRIDSRRVVLPLLEGADDGDASRAPRLICRSLP
jgi:hypothetical protein